MVLDKFNSDTVIKSWQELLKQEAASRGVDIDFQSSMWHFILEDNPKFVAGRVHKRESWEYSPPNEGRIFFECPHELDAEDRLSDAVIFSVILDLYSQSKEFDPDTDHFLVVPPEERRMLPGSDDRPTIYIENPDNGGSYYYYSPPGSNNRRSLRGNDWDILFDRIE